MSDFDAILARLPSLAQLLETQGSMSLFEYAQKSYQGAESDDPLFQSRKQELLDFLQIYVTERFDSSLAHTVVDTLRKNYAVSTAEHHGPMGHPFFFQSAILRAITNSDLPVVNFATSHVSLGNSSYPRGLIFHGDTEEAPKEYLHLPFFGSKSRMCPVFHFPAYTRNDIRTHCIGRLNAYKRLRYISDPLYQKICDFIQEHVLETSILALPSYSEQITRLNHRWWQAMFPTLPAYMSLDVEDMVVQLLLRHLQENTPFTRIMTDISLQPSIEQQFDGIACCFDQKEKKGTYLFWYLDENHRRHPLWRIGSELVSPDGSFCIQLTTEELTYHLKNHHLVPSGLLVYSMLTCYYGVTCFGGFSQGDYLPAIQKAFEKISGESKNISTQSSVINEDFVYIFQQNDEISTALDMYIFHEIHEYHMASQQISLEHSISTMQDEIGRCF